MYGQWFSSSSKLLHIVGCAVLAGALPVSAAGDVITVRSDGTGDFSSIQQAVDFATDGDVLRITGTFEETIVIPGKDLRLEGVGDAVLDANLLGTALRFDSGSDCELRLLTVRRGWGTNYEVGGMNIGANAHVHISECIFEENTSERGPALAVIHVAGTLVMDGSVVRENAADGGYGIIFSAGSLTLTNCEVTRNSGATPILVLDGDVRIAANLIADNDAGREWAGGIGVGGSGTVEIVDNIVRNCVGATGGIAVEPQDGTNVIVARNTLFGNRSSTSGGPAHLTGTRGGEIRRNILFGGTGSSFVLLDDNVSFHCNDVWSADGVPLYHGDDLTGIEGNISADPLFCDDVELCLSEDSPCLAGNHPDGADCGTIGAREDCCNPTPIEETSWGQLKTLFRHP